LRRSRSEPENAMPAFICTTCGSQYPNADTPPAACGICQDYRQYVNPQGQAWTTIAALRQTHFNAFRRLEQGLMGIATLPAFAIGQRALLLRTAQGNILWDCLSFLDDATSTIITALGGIAGIALSHPHFYGAMIDWSHNFGSVPVFLHALDRKYVTRLDPVIHFWESDSYEVTAGVTLIRCGGHFDGGTVLHWAQGAGGRGTVLSSDILSIGPDRKISFMRSYPNLIPLDAGSVRRIGDAMEPWPFETIYGSTWDKVIASDGKAVLAQSIQRYVAAVTYPPAG
jgi:hypothetical protein